MKRYRNKNTGEIIEAERWFKVEYDREAGHGYTEVHAPIYHLNVGYYRHPDFSGESVASCGFKLHDHGYLYGTGRLESKVCPGDYVILDSIGNRFVIKEVQFKDEFESYDDDNLNVTGNGTHHTVIFTNEFRKEHKYICDSLTNLWNDADDLNRHLECVLKQSIILNKNLGNIYGDFKEKLLKGLIYKEQQEMIAFSNL